MTLQEINDSIQKVNRVKERIATLRDKLREELGQLNDLVFVVESGVEDIDIAVENLERGIDSLSGMV